MSRLNVPDEPRAGAAYELVLPRDDGHATPASAGGRRSSGEVVETEAARPRVALTVRRDTWRTRCGDQRAQGDVAETGGCRGTQGQVMGGLDDHGRRSSGREVRGGTTPQSSLVATGVRPTRGGPRRRDGHRPYAQLAVAASGEAVIAVGGSHGTIAEMALALRLSARRRRRRGARPGGSGASRRRPRPSSSRYETSARRRSRKRLSESLVVSSSARRWPSPRPRRRSRRREDLPAQRGAGGSSRARRSRRGGMFAADVTCERDGDRVVQADDGRRVDCRRPRTARRSPLSADPRRARRRWPP